MATSTRTGAPRLPFWLPASIAIHALAFTWAVHHGRAQVEMHVADRAPPDARMGGESFDVDPNRDEDEAPSLFAKTESSLGQATETHRQRAVRDPGSATKIGKSEHDASPAIFGAEGDRSAVDLATAFTRAFPQTASADPIWSTAPIGSVGTIDVVLEIDDVGNLVSADVRGNGAPALRRGVERTVALFRHRVFTARAKRTTLHVSAVVSPDAVHDGLHGDVFALGGSFPAAGDASEGDAFFALAIGRRIDVRVVASATPDR